MKDENFWPSNEVIYHPFNPVFGAHLSEESFRNRECFLLRDGGLGLLEFFSKYPVAPMGKDIYVPADYYFLVPTSWQKQTKLYRVIGPLPETKIDRLFLYGMFLSDDVVFHWKLQNWLEKFDKDLPVSAHVTGSYPILEMIQSYFTKEVIITSRPGAILSGKDSSTTFASLDLWRMSFNFCALESKNLSRLCQVVPRFKNLSFHSAATETHPLSFKHHLEIFPFTANDQNVEIRSPYDLGLYVLRHFG